MSGVARNKIIREYPYPIAYPYSLVFEEATPPSKRRWALCFTVYQLLRMVSLPLVCQYLRETGTAAGTADSVRSLNMAVTRIRQPFFSDWIALVYSLVKHLPRVGINPLFPELPAAIDALKQPEPRSVGQRGVHLLRPLEAVLALRNTTAHGGLADEDEAAQHLDAYVP